MFDAHAHPEAIIDNAFVCSASTSDYDNLCPFRYKAIGTLPESSTPPDFSIMERAAANGFHIGEIGLDRRWPDMERQEHILRKALSIAREYDKIAVIHIVREYGKVLEIIKEMDIHQFMIHGFTGSRETAEEFIRLGGIISLSPRAVNTKHFSSLLTLPFVTETDMLTGEKEMNELEKWNHHLMALTGLDTGKRTEEIMKELLHG